MEYVLHPLGWRLGAHNSSVLNPSDSPTNLVLLLTTWNLKSKLKSALYRVRTTVSCTACHLWTQLGIFSA